MDIKDYKLEIALKYCCKILSAFGKLFGDTKTPEDVYKLAIEKATKIMKGEQDDRTERKS
jgi:hypothetical protein